VRVRRFALFAIPVLSVTATLFACADDDSDATGASTSPDARNTETRPDTGEIDSDTSTDGEDASDADAADAEIPEKTCSDEDWCHTLVPAGQVLRDVWSDGAGSAWAVSDQGAVLRYDGRAWSVAHTHAAANAKLVSIWGSSPTDIWIGAYGAILHGTGTTPATITWTELVLDQLAPGAGAVSIYGTSSTDVFAAVGTAVLRLGDNGAGWAVDPVTSEIAGTSVSVWGRAGTNDVWISTMNTATKKSVLFHRTGGPSGSFTPVEGVSEVKFNVLGRACATPGEPRRGWMVDDRTIWLVGTRVNFTNTCYYAFCGIENPDAGAADAGPFAFSGNVFYDPYFRLNDVWGSSPNDVWLVGDFGTLNHWNGTSWQLAGISVEQLPVKNNLNAVYGRGPGDIWVVGDGIALHKGAL
jgi:hypothetical protein